MNSIKTTSQIAISVLVLLLASCGSDSSNTATDTTPIPAFVPTLTVVSPTSISVAWAAVDGATHYQVWRHTTNNNTASDITHLTANTTLTATSYADESLTTDTTYYYWIKSCRPADCSAFSVGTPGTPSVIAAAVDHHSIFTQPSGQSNEADWSSQTDTTNDGTDALQSGVVQEGGSTCFETEVLGPGIVSFDWKVDSEQSVDFLSFWIDGNERGKISGDVDWQKQSYRINSRENAMLQWCYRKDSADDVTAGTAYIDQISTNTSALTIRPGLLRFSWPAVAGHHYRIQASNGGGADYRSLADATSLSTTTYEIPISTHLFNWGQRQYRIQSCNANESVCLTVSEEVPTLDDSIASISYIKPRTIDAGDGFGTTVTLSSDGNTMVVGAIGEDSAPGLSGNSEQDSGAANVFARMGLGWSEQLLIKASNGQAGDRFGASVALSGDGNTLAVGAVSEDGTLVNGVADPANNGAISAGAVYVFARTGGSWTEQAYIKASNPEREDLFGASVALSNDGNTLAVGANFEDGSSAGIDGTDNNDAMNAGAVYVFVRSGTSWTQQAYIKASNPETGDQFGFAVNLSDDGNTLAVGALAEDGSSAGINGADNNDAVDAGAVYVFVRSGTSWTQQAYIKASNPGAVDQFGVSINLSGDGNTLAVGALAEDGSSAGINGADNNDAMNAGAAYVFTRAGTSWTQQAYIKASNPGIEDGFGFSVALSGDGSTLAVGAFFEDGSSAGINGADNNDGIDAGAAYVFTRAGTSWSQQSYVKASNTEGIGSENIGDIFGSFIALDSDGGTLAVSASAEDDQALSTRNDATNAGAVYVY